MTDTNDPGYPQYGGGTEPLPDPRPRGAPPPPPPSPPPAAGAAARLGARLLPRPTPRFSIVLAGAGAALLLAGALYWAVRFYADGLDFRLDGSALSGGGNGSRQTL